MIMWRKEVSKYAPEARFEDTFPSHYFYVIWELKVCI